MPVFAPQPRWLDGQLLHVPTRRRQLAHETKQTPRRTQRLYPMMWIDWLRRLPIEQRQLVPARRLQPL